MIEIRPGVKQSSVDAILATPRDIEKTLLAAGLPAVTADQVLGGGTLFVDGEPKVVAGVVQVAPKIGMAWLLSSVDLKPYVRPLLRALRVGMKQAESRGLQLVAKVHVGQPTAISFIEHLGFTPIGKPESTGYQLYIRKD